MITMVLFLAEAFKTNKSFQPFGLYVVTFIIDIAIIDAIMK